MGGVENLWIGTPARDFCERIATKNEKNLRRLQTRAMQRMQRVDRVRRPGAPEFTVGGAHPRIRLDRQREQRKAVKGAATRVFLAGWGVVRRHQLDFVELQGGLGGVRGVEMSVVHRVERATQQTNPAHVSRRAAYATG